MDEYEFEPGELDISWIEEFDKQEKEYAEDLQYIQCKYVYINNDSKIEKTNQETIFFKTPGILTKEELICLIKHNIDTKYSLLSILKFNISIDNNAYLKHFLNPNTNVKNNNYLVPVKTIDDIKFDKTINIFHDINELLILFYKKTNVEQNRTKRTKLICNNKTKRNSIY